MLTQMPEYQRLTREQKDPAHWGDEFLLLPVSNIQHWRRD
jgi:hypothetical protein